jgi:uncharacterized protein (DUF1684 family)
MATYQYTPGFGAVGSYQTSGIPWVTGSDLDPALASYGQVKIEFPRITKSFTVINKTADSSSIYVHFQDRNTNPNTITNKHYVQLPDAYSGFTFNVRTNEVYLSLPAETTTGSFTLYAELTPIDRREMKFTLTGSGIDE